MSDNRSSGSTQNDLINQEKFRKISNQFKSGCPVQSANSASNVKALSSSSEYIFKKSTRPKKNKISLHQLYLTIKRLLYPTVILFFLHHLIYQSFSTY